MIDLLIREYDLARLSMAEHNKLYNKKEKVNVLINWIKNAIRVIPLRFE